MENNVDKLHLGLAMAVLGLLDYKKRYEALSDKQELDTDPIRIASQALGCSGALNDDALQEWLREFVNGPVAERVAAHGK